MIKSLCRLQTALLLTAVIIVLPSTGFAQGANQVCECNVKDVVCVPSGGVSCSYSIKKRDQVLFNCEYAGPTIRNPEGGCQLVPQAANGECGSGCDPNTCSNMTATVRSATNCTEVIQADGSTDCVGDFEDKKVNCSTSQSTGKGKLGVKVSGQTNCSACKDKPACSKAACQIQLTAASCDPKNPSKTPDCADWGTSMDNNCSWTFKIFDVPGE